MNRDMREMLNSPATTDEVMDVEMPFLDAFRRNGTQGVDQLRQQDVQNASQPETVQPEAELQEQEPELETPRENPQPGSATPPEGPDVVAGDDQRSAEREEELLVPDHEPEEGDDERVAQSSPSPQSRFSRGGTTSGTGAGGTSADPAGAVPGPPEHDSDTLDTAVTEDGLSEAAALATVAPPVSTSPASSEASTTTTPTSLTLTDHQNAVQSAATKGGSGGTDDTAALPQSGFRLDGVKSQPAVRALPEPVVSALREQLRAAAVRELQVSDVAARDFAGRLSQASLVTAFLLARFDLGLSMDPATHRAAELFRAQDPLLGAMATRMEALEKLEHEHVSGLRVLREQLSKVAETSAVIEQALAYSIADDTVNFLRGSHNIHDAPLGHKDAIFVRDRAREATRKQLKLEREREGRPIR